MKRRSRKRSSFFCMKLLYLIALFLFCKEITSQTFEFIPNSKDTVNYTHYKEGRKGKWIIMGQHRPKTCYTPSQIVETGMYEKDRKEGLWKAYHCDGQLKSEQLYVHGNVNGPVTLYHENGKLSARGTFKIDHWVNDLELFDMNGGLLYRVNFDEKGNRIRTTFFCYTKTKRDSTIIFKALP
jgi:antitoxin component YwqK of YwqJK toxin-antitoxin module